MRIVDRGQDAATPEQRALGTRLDDDVGDQPRELDVVGSDREQHQVETAVGAGAACFRQGVRQLVELRRHLAGARQAGAWARAIAGALAVEQAGVDGGARAAERNVSHGQVRVLDRETERRAHLVTVQRSVARAAHPARALQCPLARFAVVTQDDVAGPVAVEACAPGPVVFAALEALEAESFVGEAHGAVGIAFAGRDRVAQAGDQHVAHLDIAGYPLRGAVGQHDVHARDRQAVAAHAQLYLLGARRIGLARRPLAVVEGPKAAFVGGKRTGEPRPDAKIARREIALALAVAVAGVEELAGAVHA